MNNYLIAFRIDKEDDDYIRSVCGGVCPINDIYRSIYSTFCDKIRKNERKRKKNAKTNPTNKAQRGKGKEKNPPRKNTRGGRVAGRKNTKGLK